MGKADKDTDMNKCTALECGRMAQELAAILSLTPDSIILVDDDYAVRFVNEAFCRLVGKEREELVGRHVAQAVAPLCTDEFLARLRECIGGKSCEPYECEGLSGDERRAVSFEFARFEDEHLLGALATGRDITALKQAEEELRLSKVIVEQSPVILFRRINDPDDPRLVFASENIRPQLGYEPQEFISGERQFRDIIHPEDFERISSEVKGYREGGDDEYVQEYRIIKPDGEAVWVDDKTRAERDEHGETTHYQGIIVNITDRKQAELALKASEEKYRRIIDTAAEGFMLLDLDYRITDVNDAACIMLGRGRSELLGRRPREFSIGGMKSSGEDDPVCGGEHCAQFEETFVDPKGRLIPALIHMSTLRDGTGLPVGKVIFVTDMTGPKKALALAEEVQKSLLPQGATRLGGLDIAGRCITCDEIGGDYFDIFDLQGRREGVAVAVGDISGHGVDSALLMTTARAFLRMRVAAPGSTAQIMNELNHHLTPDLYATSRFMTMFILQLAPQDGRLRWVRAGHDPALVYQPSLDAFHNLDGGGMPLGVDESVPYREFEVAEPMDDRVIAIGTDGIWEARGRDGEMYGKERLKAIIRAHAKESSQTILSALYDDLEHYTRRNKPEDDVTLVVIKKDGSGEVAA
jgi:sigma-B regulation protein RsbU (phosphoserine phosphatase)